MEGGEDEVSGECGIHGDLRGFFIADFTDEDDVGILADDCPETVVFYTAHSVVTVSWPFLIVLALVFVGNEYFRMYKQYLVFQTTLLFFSLYAYTIFGVPLILGSLGPLVFAWSTLAAVVLFGLFLLALRLLNTARYKESRTRIFQAFAAIKGFLEKEEGPWFRTPKTGRITDVFARSGIMRFITGIIPVSKSIDANYLAINSANSTFEKLLNVGTSVMRKNAIPMERGRTLFHRLKTELTSRIVRRIGKAVSMLTALIVSVIG
jgi:hypothetical protein